MMLCVGYKLPRVRKVLALIRKPVIVAGLLAAILIFYFQYRHFFHIFSWRHTLASWTLSLAGGLAGGLTAHFFRLDKRRGTHRLLSSYHREGIDTILYRGKSRAPPAFLYTCTYPKYRP